MTKKSYHSRNFGLGQGSQEKLGFQVHHSVRDVSAEIRHHGRSVYLVQLKEIGRQDEGEVTEHQQAHSDGRPNIWKEIWFLEESGRYCSSDVPVKSSLALRSVHRAHLIHASSKKLLLYDKPDRHETVGYSNGREITTACLSRTMLHQCHTSCGALNEIKHAPMSYSLCQQICHQ